MWVAFALQKLLTFSSKIFQHICVSLDVNFNESLTYDIVSFEQLGPVCFLFTPIGLMVRVSRVRVRRVSITNLFLIRGLLLKKGIWRWVNSFLFEYTFFQKGEKLLLTELASLKGKQVARINFRGREIILTEYFSKNYFSSYLIGANLKEKNCPSLSINSSPYLFIYLFIYLFMLVLKWSDTRATTSFCYLPFWLKKKKKKSFTIIHFPENLLSGKLGLGLFTVFQRHSW